MGRCRRLRPALPPHRLVAGPDARGSLWALGARSHGRRSHSGGDGYYDVGYHRMGRAASRFAVQTACGCVFRAGTLASPSPVERRSRTESPSTNTALRDSRVAPLPAGSTLLVDASGAA